ncbi:ankyrin [Morchella conica CCBAS932]|uniref:Ankyrin n=1 Tax=Morchella conica CCBAS932 TaxID=1392247 RepID=A0A3N4K7K9_9PEZI|nr:ankyrin [Morchella conica CCBAS932]
MFMWVNLQIDALCAAQTAEDVRSALSTMPETLNETYLQVMERIKAQDRNAHRVAKEILKWLLYAQEACTTGSVIQALAVEPEKKSLNKSGLSWTVLKIMGICKNLVIHDKTLDIFRFAHFSVQEFLLSQAEYEKKSCNSYTAKICLTTLLYHHASDAPVQDLYTYAAKNWAAHVRLSEDTSGKVEDLCMRFWNSSTPYKAWGSIIVTTEDMLKAQVGSDVVCPFWVACHYELQYLNTLLLHVSGQELNSCNAYGRTPLSWAAGKGHEKAVQLLLEKKGVEVNSKNNSGDTPLSSAISGGKWKVVQLLLEKEGLDVDSKDDQGRTPLDIARQKGHSAVVRMLEAKRAELANVSDPVHQLPVQRIAADE